MSCELIIQIFFDTFILSNLFSDREKRSRWSVFVRIFVSKGNLFLLPNIFTKYRLIRGCYVMLFKTLLKHLSGQFSSKTIVFSLETIFQTINLLCRMFFTVSSSLFLLPVMIYEVVEEEQEGEDTTGDGDYDEWENRNVFRSNKQLVN